MTLGPKARFKDTTTTTKPTTFEKHDHVNICSSKKEHHFHEVDNDCSTLHLQLTGYTYESFFQEPTLLVHLYGTLFDFWKEQFHQTS